MVPMAGFVGRREELSRLSGALDSVVRDGSGRFLTVRGPRQVGKSTLLQQFCDRVEVPTVFFAAARGASPEEERGELVRVLAESELPAADRFVGVTFDGWDPLLRQLAAAVEGPAVVVIDELPWLLEGDPSFEGRLQRIWDTALRTRPILLVAVGSDLSIMEAIASHDRPLFGRVAEMVVNPLTPSDVATLTGLSDPAEALDAYLVTGGYPRILLDWPEGWSWRAAITAMMADATSALVVVGERILNGAFPVELQARAVLEVLGRGASAVSWRTLQDACGLNEGSLTRSMNTLIDDLRLVERRRPLAGKRSRLTRFDIIDPYLRFWLTFVGPSMEMVLRGRGDQVAGLIASRWRTYAGHAIEPLVRSTLERSLPMDQLGAATFVGSWWDRHDEVDLVAAAAPSGPADPLALGSIKWREDRPFGRSDALDLVSMRAVVPGAAAARLVGVSRTGFDPGLGLDLAWTPEDLLAPR